MANRIGHGSSVTRIDKATETIVATIPVDTAPRVVAVDGSSVWAVSGRNTVEKIEVSSNNVVAQIEVGDQPRGLGDMTGFEFDFFFGPVVDTTPPVITSAISGTLGLNDWYTSDVTVEWTVTDPDSAISSTSGCETSTVTSDTAGTTFTCEATSGGGPATKSQIVKRDATAPTITGSASPDPNGNGWNNSDVTVTYTFSDGGSGIDQASGDLGPHVLTGEGQGLSDSGLAVDLAGNSASYTVTGISIDKTAPDITIVVPEDGAEYVLLEEVLASWSASDTLSGMASTTAPVADGTAIDTSTEGSILFEVVATDTAGNISSVTHSYTVLSPAEAAGNMVQTVADLDLPAGAEGSLTAKLDAAIAALDRGSDKAAVNNLNAFKNYVRAQSGKKINESDADTLIAEAERIIAAIEAG